MRTIRLLLLFFISIFCLSCKKEEKPSAKSEEKPTYKYFEYSFDSEDTNFSMQIKPNDSIYIRNRFYHWHSKNDIKPKEIETYYLAIITKSQRKELNSLISKIPFKKYDSLYQKDCFRKHYVTYIDKDSIKKLVFVSDFKKSPDQLDSLIKWLNIFKTNSKWIKTSKKIDFKTRKYVTIPPPPPMPVKK
ncbi:hypothetical protein [Flavobacterium seoulense]|uniref:Uncharacterized protein n=1 Tax=Flavobacterium seoulense TaxID=1492738 RepID=A0A066WJE1_9FLAO|nr:hypothetical protein [Flavobacterium seoulense]KDN53936.1 hypothetical protein FEM21_29550 [Flavobacterium seoulense]